MQEKLPQSAVEYINERLSLLSRKHDRYCNDRHRTIEECFEVAGGMKELQKILFLFNKIKDPTWWLTHNRPKPKKRKSKIIKKGYYIVTNNV